MFNVGDIIKGLPNNYYNITSEDAVMEVMSVDEINCKMRVKVLSHATMDTRVGFKATVANNSKRFELVSSSKSKKEEKKVFTKGDMVRRVNEVDKFKTRLLTNYNVSQQEVDNNEWLVDKTNGASVWLLSPTTNIELFSWDSCNFELIEKKEGKKVEKVYSGLPKRVVFQYSESTKKGATILFWSDNKEDKTVVKLADGDKFDKQTGFLWGWYMDTSNLSRTKVNTMLSFVKKPSVKKYLKFQFKEITGMNSTEIDTYLDKMCK